MTRDETVEFATRLGWKVWGRYRKYNHSHYQCFRRKDEYIWIGARFVERSFEPEAIDFVGEGHRVEKFLL